MIKRLLREVYMLPRGEQRALLIVSFLLILSVGIRILVQLFPEREPSGMDEFVNESRALMAAMAHADSLKANRPPPTTYQSPPTNHRPTPTYQSPPTKNQSPPININRADSVQLLPLPGIGPVFARRIIRYRELLGGFVHLDQLLEVYGFPVETLKLIRDRITFDTVAIRKICMDSASFRDLLRHPYLDLEDVKALVAYRDFKHNISTLSELREAQVLPDSILIRIGPYLEMKCERNPK
jgi:DNA uptake protein ComE-like DNA-binding protein